MSASRDHAPTTGAGLDLSKIRPGDEVLVRVIVTESPRENDQWPVRGTIHGFSTAPSEFEVEGYFSPHSIVSHIPKALAVGDLVRWRSATWTWAIIAIDREWAWLRDECDCGVIKRLADLERVR